MLKRVIYVCFNIFLFIFLTKQQMWYKYLFYAYSESLSLIHIAMRMYTHLYPFPINSYVYTEEYYVCMFIEPLITHSPSPLRFVYVLYPLTCSTIWLKTTSLAADKRADDRHRIASSSPVCAVAVSLVNKRRRMQEMDEWMFLNCIKSAER